MNPQSSPLKYRSLNRDGTDNIDRSQMVRGIDDLYHVLLSLRWPRFFGTTVLLYVAINVVFGLIYFSLGAGSISGARTDNTLHFLMDCFFFSVQTFSTIGYGVMAPSGFVSNLMVAAEAFTGMLSIAVMSGILFARFSRPTARVKFSHNALVTNHRGRQSLVFRMANARLNQVAEAQVSVVLLKSEVTPEGHSMRVQYDLPLLRNRSLFFAGSWIVAHVIDQSSPLFGCTARDLEDTNCEIFVSVTGFDETFSQTINARFSYLFDEVLWSRQFVDMVTRKEGKIFVDISKISTLVEASN